MDTVTFGMVAWDVCVERDKQKVQDVARNTRIRFLRSRVLYKQVGKGWRLQEPELQEVD